MNTVSERISIARKRKELTNKQLANSLDMKEGAYNKALQRGRFKPLVLKKIAEVLEVSYEWLSEGLGEISIANDPATPYGKEFNHFAAMNLLDSWAEKGIDQNEINYMREVVKQFSINKDKLDRLKKLL